MFKMRLFVSAFRKNFVKWNTILMHNATGLNNAQYYSVQMRKGKRINFNGSALFSARTCYGLIKCIQNYENFTIPWIVSKFSKTLNAILEFRLAYVIIKILVVLIVSKSKQLIFFNVYAIQG